MSDTPIDFMLNLGLFVEECDIEMNVKAILCY